MGGNIRQGTILPDPFYLYSSYSKDYRMNAASPYGGRFLIFIPKLKNFSIDELCEKKGKSNVHYPAVSGKRCHSELYYFKANLVSPPQPELIKPEMIIPDARFVRNVRARQGEPCYIMSSEMFDYNVLAYPNKHSKRSFLPSPNEVYQVLIEKVYSHEGGLRRRGVILRSFDKNDGLVMDNKRSLKEAISDPNVWWKIV